MTMVYPASVQGRPLRRNLRTSAGQAPRAELRGARGTALRNETAIHACLSRVRTTSCSPHREQPPTAKTRRTRRCTSSTPPHSCPRRTRSRSHLASARSQLPRSGGSDRAGRRALLVAARRARGRRHRGHGGRFGAADSRFRSRRRADPRGRIRGDALHTESRQQQSRQEFGDCPG